MSQAVVARYRLPIVAVTIATIGVWGFFIAMKRLANDEADRAGLPRSARNSIQHAYAAAETYAGLRVVGLSPSIAQEVVVKLGYLNEWVENRVQNRDKLTAEIYKDLNNNLSGIVAAEWLKPCGIEHPRTRLRLIGQLAKAQAIYYLSDDGRIPELPKVPDLSAAIIQFEADRLAISERVSKVLHGFMMPCSEEL